MTKYILAIDQGTTSSRAIVFDTNLRPVSTGQQEFEQIFPNSGWVEHNPDEIWSSTVGVCSAAIEKAGISAADIAAIAKPPWCGTKPPVSLSTMRLFGRIVAPLSSVKA